MQQLKDLLHNYIHLPPLPFLASLLLNFSIICSHMTEKFINKSTQKISIFSSKSHYARGLIFSLLSLLLLFGCAKKKEPPKSPSSFPVNLAPVISQDVPIYIEAFGSLLSSDAITLTAQVNGQLIAIPVQEGQRVKKGELIAQIDPRNYQAALDAAKAQLEKDRAALKYAEVTVESYTQLLPDDYVSALNYAQYVANLEAAKAAIHSDLASIEQAQINLEYTQILAPVDGAVGLFQVFPGNFVNAGSQNATITTLEKITSIDALFALPEKELHKVRTYQAVAPLKVEASFLDPSQPHLMGEVYALNNAIDPQTGTISLKAVFPNEDLNGWPGQFARIKLLLHLKENAIVVPVSAIQTGQDGLYVYVAIGGALVFPQPVTVEHYFEKLAIIESGLEAGLTVVTDGQINLYPGAPVHAKQGSP